MLHREAGHTTAPDRMHRTDRRKCLRQTGRPHTIWTRSAHLHTGPRRVICRIERPDTRQHLTACTEPTKNCLHQRGRPHTFCHAVESSNRPWSSVRADDRSPVTATDYYLRPSGPSRLGGAVATQFQITRPDWSAPWLRHRPPQQNCTEFLDLRSILILAIKQLRRDSRHITVALCQGDDSAVVGEFELSVFGEIPIECDLFDGPSLPVNRIDPRE